MKFVIIVVMLLLPTTTLAHTIEDVNAHFDANHCELYVDTFGVGDFHYIGSSMKVLEVALKVNRRDLESRENKIIEVGVRSLERVIASQVNDKGNPILSVTDRAIDVPAEHMIEGSYRIHYEFEQVADAIEQFVEVKGVAFYVDVQNEDGDIFRYWQKFYGNWYELDSIINAPSTIRYSTGIGLFRYAPVDSPIYMQRVSCS